MLGAGTGVIGSGPQQELQVLIIPELFLQFLLLPECFNGMLIPCHYLHDLVCATSLSPTNFVLFTL